MIKTGGEPGMGYEANGVDFVKKLKDEIDSLRRRVEALEEKVKQV